MHDSTRTTARGTGVAGQRFDHIVVGGGAAGSVVAARLSADAERTVLVLEAGGPDDDPRMISPFGVFGLQRGEFDWSDTTIPQHQLNGREIAVSAGRTLGGGGTINYMAWYRGNRLDYDTWSAGGMTDWGWDNVLPIFRRTEDHELGSSTLHGAGGPIAVTTPRDINQLSLRFITAGVDSGLPLNRDFNGAEQDGVGLLYSNVRDGERDSAARGYLRPAMERPNLTVRTGATVHRIVTRNGAVRGVSYTDANGVTSMVSSDSVILSAGPIRTPQLLMLSGIGPRGHLREHGIDLVADLQGVGQNLQDHPTAFTVWPVRHGETWLDANTPANQKLYTEARRGPQASIGQAGAFLRCGDDAPAPDIQLTPMLMDFSGGSDPAFTCLVTLLTPRSRGSLRLRSADPAAAPLLDPRYLEDVEDRTVLVRGLRRTLEICGNPALQELLGTSRFPDLRSSDDELLAFIRTTMMSINHPVGTCRAGTDDAAVVDPELRVHGVEGLRVIDSSVMPTIPRGNTHAPSLMIGERGSDLLLKA